MDEVSKTGILIDVCPKCKGVWLDRGELNQLLERVKVHQQEYDAYYEKSYHSEPKSQHYDKHNYKHGDHKKKNLFKTLSDMFD
jgi:hypothetical protein